jgi:formate-dependent nitrite reductase membrane component NrfD
MVPDADFRSYYGRPVLKAAPWGADIPTYLFAGGLAGGSSLLAAGADLSDRPALRRVARLGALGAISVSLVALVHDLGRPTRFVNMLRVAKPTSPMSVGSWLLAAYGPCAAAAGAAELIPARGPGRALAAAARPAGLAAAVIGPAVASYTAALLADTATPTWHDAYRQLPFVFVGSAAAASGGLAMITAPASQARPARVLARGGAMVELAAESIMETSMGLTAEPLRRGRAGQLRRASRILTAAGLLASFGARRHRLAAVASGSALVAGSACTRFAVFAAGQASARDPKYTVVPQRERMHRAD